jgi:hypothetical protein
MIAAMSVIKSGEKNKSNTNPRQRIRLGATSVAPSRAVAPHDGFDSQRISLRLLWVLSCFVAGVKSAFAALFAF